MALLIALMSSICAFSVAAPAVARRDPKIEARVQIRTLVAGIQQIERIRAKAPPDAMDASCVDEKLAEARAGLQIAAAELARLDDGLAARGGAEDDYALHRLRMLVERAGELGRAARVCATEELSTIDTTKVEVEISPSVPKGDPTALPWGFVPPERPPSQ